MKKPFSNRVAIFAALIIIAILASLFLYQVIQKWRISMKLEAAITSQLEEFRNALGSDANHILTIPNLWNAESVVVCRGYLEYSKPLENRIFNSGISELAAHKIANSPRWTEGAHIYLVKKDELIYIYCFPLHVRGKDFISNKIGKEIYLDIRYTPWKESVTIDSNATAPLAAKIFFLDAIR